MRPAEHPEASTDTTAMFTETFNDNTQIASQIPSPPELRLSDESPIAPLLLNGVSLALSPQPNAPSQSANSTDNVYSLKDVHLKVNDLWEPSEPPAEDGNDEGSVVVSIGVLDLLTSVVGKLSSKDLGTLHGVVLQWQRLVILVHHPSANVRAAVLRVSTVRLCFH